MVIFGLFLVCFGSKPVSDGPLGPKGPSETVFEPKKKQKRTKNNQSETPNPPLKANPMPYQSEPMKSALACPEQTHHSNGRRSIGRPVSFESFFNEGAHIFDSGPEPTKTSATPAKNQPQTNHNLSNTGQKPNKTYQKPAIDSGPGISQLA